MKRILLYALLLLALAGCSKPHLYITYDTVQVHQDPSEESGVLATISCAPRPARYRETPKSKVLYWTGADNTPRPLAVIKTDKSKQWGYVSLLFLEARKNVRGWVQLSQLEPIAEADKGAGITWIIIAGCILALAISILLVLKFRKKKTCSETTSSQ